MSTTQTPPPDAPAPDGPPERRCPRCGSTLAPDQEWCLACGAAADTEVVEARGWRVPLYLGGALAALAVIGVILAIVALATRNQEVAQNPSGTPTPAPTTSAIPTTTPAPTTSAIPTTTPSAVPTTTASPGVTTTPFPSPTAAPTTSPSTGSSFPGWTGSDGDYTIIIESSKTRSGAETVAQRAEDNGETVGILNSDDYSSLNGGYYVVFTGTYATKSQAQDALDSVRDDHGDAYVRQIKQ